MRYTRLYTDIDSNGLGQRDVRGDTHNCFIFVNFFLQRGWKKIVFMLVSTWLEWLKRIQSDYVRKLLRSPQSIFRILLPCAEEKLCGYQGKMPIAIRYKYNARKVIYFIATEDAGSIKYDITY